MTVLFEAPLLVHLYLLHYFFYESHFIDLHPKVPIFLVSIFLFFLPFHLRASFLTEMFVLLEYLKHKIFPKIEVISGINDDWHSIELDGDLAGDEVEGVDVTLIDHLGRVEEHVLLVAEGLHQEEEELADGGSPCLEELRVDHQANDLLYGTVHDAVPTVFAETSLDKGMSTVRNYKISVLSKVGSNYGQAWPCYLIS